MELTDVNPEGQKTFKRFYDENNNSCINYNGQLIYELFIGKLDDLKTVYKLKEQEFATLELVMAEVDKQNA